MRELQDKQGTLTREFLRYGADISALPDGEGCLDNFMGAWETYTLLLNETEPLGCSIEFRRCKFSSRLHHILWYFCPVRRFDRPSESYPQDFLAWDKRHLDFLGSTISTLISEGASLHRNPDTKLGTTLLQRVLLENSGVDGPAQSNDLLWLVTHYPEYQGVCFACSYQKAMPEPSLEEWLLLLKSNGVDLFQYALRESEDWADSARRDEPYLDQNSWPWLCGDVLLVSERQFALRRRILIDVKFSEDKIFVHDVGILRRTVRLCLNMEEQLFEGITFEDSWENDELGHGACFCRDDKGNPRTREEIEEAEKFHQPERQQFRKDRITAEMEDKIVNMPGAWQVDA